MATRNRTEFWQAVLTTKPRILALMTAKDKMKPVTIRAELNIDEGVCRACLEGMRDEGLLGTTGRYYYLLAYPPSPVPPDPVPCETPLEPVFVEKTLELVRVENGKPITDSRLVAEQFGKNHANVLKAIENLDCSSSFRDVNFDLAEFIDLQGKSRPYYKLTRDGFFFLAMGFTGAEAARFKERFIAAFNAMESQLLKQIGPLEHILETLTGIAKDTNMAMLNGFGLMNTQLITVDKKVDAVDSKVERINYRQAEMEKKVETIARRGRRKITPAVRSRHCQAVNLMGGNCPCCGIRKIIDNGMEIDAEGDHFYQNSLADELHTWLICKPCHADLSHGKVPRGSREPEFKAYQSKMQRLPGFQPILFAT